MWANARLIAAAPDLLSALQEAHETLGESRRRFARMGASHAEIDCVMLKVEQAIARATGGEA